VRRILRTTGLEAHEVRSSLWDLVREGEVVLDSHTLGTDIIIRCNKGLLDETKRHISTIEEKVRDRLGDYIYGTDSETLEKVVGYLLSLRGMWLGVAESCTGGLLMDHLTNVPGSSNYLRGGVVAYSEEVKIKLLGVPKELIEREGVVSGDVALGMANGIVKLLSVDLGVGITGVAGPTGGDERHPVGEAFIALVSKGRNLVRRFRFSGNREEIKLKVTQAALDMIRRELIQ
jgi:nicotinamide-nucleotide amidase